MVMWLFPLACVSSSCSRSELRVVLGLSIALSIKGKPALAEATSSTFVVANFLMLLVFMETIGRWHRPKHMFRFSTYKRS